MKAMIVLLVVSALCATAVAAGQVAPAPRPSANRQYSSNILNSPDVVTIPRQLSYQGRLTDTLGVPVSDSSYPVTFRLYDMPSGGTPFWSESLDVQTSGGLFTVLLGSTRPVDSMPAYGLAYLAMQVGSGSELVPRMQLVSSAYSFVAGNAARLDGNDMSVLDVRYLQNGSPAGGDLGGDYPNPTVDGLQGRSVAGTAPGANQVLKWTGSAWVRGTPDSVLYTVNQLGIVRGGAGNMLYGNLRCTHTNFGVACTTGVSGQNTAGVTISGGTSNLASSDYCTIAGGRFNGATMHDATVAGGNKDTASAVSSTVGGGYHNVASADYATIAGGDMNRAPGTEALEPCRRRRGGYSRRGRRRL
jgi:hypothetical protein